MQQNYPIMLFENNYTLNLKKMPIKKIRFCPNV